VYVRLEIPHGCGDRIGRVAPASLLGREQSVNLRLQRAHAAQHFGSVNLHRFGVGNNRIGNSVFGLHSAFLSTL
jgi:hypothetical protein